MHSKALIVKTSKEKVAAHAIAVFRKMGKGSGPDTFEKTLKARVFATWYNDNGSGTFECIS